MCGVIGYRPRGGSGNPKAAAAFARLMGESQVRGMHAYGLYQPGVLMGEEEVKNYYVRSLRLEDVTKFFDPDWTAVAHCRYSTSGDWKKLENNQPLIVRDRGLVFNGVIHMGTKEEFEKAFGVHCDTDNDGEVFLRLIEQMEARHAPVVFPREALPGVYTDIINTLEGSFAGCWVVDGSLYAGRNARRPLWRNFHLDATWYASTRDIFRRAGFPEPEAVEVGVEVS
jgi:glutamine phosphoribosylpyrophosphate amidotransferase